MPFTGESRILIPVDVSVSEQPDRALLEFFQPVDVVILGYYPVPQQTAPAHLKQEHESEAAKRLEEIVSRFENTDHEVQGVLVFTKDRKDTIDRIADQHDCDAVLIPGEVEQIGRILVPLRGDTNLDRIITLLGELVQTNDASVTLFHSVADDTDRSQGEFILRGAIDRLVEDGVERDSLDWQLSESGNPESAIVNLAAEYDLLILGETKPSLRERIIGTVLTPVLDNVDIPAIIVRDTT